jgi:nicotinate-nucleotide adenylyltransferase
MKPLAILGGTFDPVHLGHLLIAQTALSQLELDNVIWIPARRPPHKGALAYEHRCSMVEKAIADNPAFVLNAVQTEDTDPDYAIETLTHLQQAYPNRQWYWIIGIDAFQTLPRWYHCEKLALACDWLVAPRPVSVAATTAVFLKGNSENKEIDTQISQLCQQVSEQFASQNIPLRWQLLQMPLVDISSSLIRQYCRQGHSIRYLVPENVRAYIMTHTLYSESTN